MSAETLCGRSVVTYGPCQLAPGHHGPCTAPNGAKAWFGDPQCGASLVHRGWHGAVADCAECERLDAEEVLRLDAGGELGPLQKAPGWLKQPKGSPIRDRQVKWARRVLEVQP